MFFDRWVSPRRSATIADLQRGKNAGELRADTEPDLLNDAIFGAIYYRFLLGSHPFTRRFGEELVEQVIRGHHSENAWKAWRLSGNFVEWLSKAQEITHRTESDAQQDHVNHLQFESMEQEECQYHLAQRGHIELLETCNS